MRTIGWLLTILVLSGWALSEVPVARTGSDEPPALQWRRTSDGWERQSVLAPPPVACPPALHPAVVGSLELLVSLAALIAFPPARHVSNRAAEARG